MNDNDDDDNAARGANYNSARSALLLTTPTSMGLLLPRNTGGRIVASWLKNSRTNDDSNIGFARRGGRKKTKPPLASVIVKQKVVLLLFRPSGNHSRRHGSIMMLCGWDSLWQL